MYIKKYYGLFLPPRSLLKTVAVTEIGVKMLPLWRSAPSVSRGLSCRTSPVKRLYAYAASPLSEPLEDLQAGTAEGVELSPQSVQGNADWSGFRIARELEHNGASLEATCNREQLIFSSDCLRDNLGLVIEHLANSVNKPAFNRWELEGIVNRLKLDLAVRDTQPQINVVEELHRVAFRKTLGNSLYCLPHRTGKFTSDVLIDFTKKCYVGQRMAIVGVGVDHSQLVDLAKAAFSFLPEGEPVPKEATKYHGGEVMNFRSGPLVHAVLATEGARLGSKDHLAFSVYQKVLGATPSIKWGSNMASNRLLKAAAAESADGAFSASAFNASYSDGGLFGFYVAAEPSNVSKVMKSVVGQFSKASKGDISDQDITRAKNQTKAHLLMHSESQDTLVEDIGSQLLTKGSYTSPQEVAAAVDSITKTDILTVAKRVFSGKPSLSAAGDVSTMPGLDELF
ncbi:Cytochrome b-c1 complex subunit 2, mitochondrial [Desmophyllum pertusum]|uniref:Cytochrome b-c1 complex subunit 2, mitochondrial n=1 Tax=Desmophyllum pertusum TaxID=174260 RepID=A0A9W9Z1M1_9CNID|nr:Cytochrome b-c1 complex subunit 2, mitochondrial [Desmophyllum pertusum]